MRLLNHIKILNNATKRLPAPTNEERNTRPTSESANQPVCNLTRKEFSITTPSDGAIARRRSVKDETRVKCEILHDELPLLDTKLTETSCNLNHFTPESALAMKAPEQKQHNPYFPIEPPQKRKRDLDDVVRRVKSARHSVNKRMLMDLFDESENDLRRYKIRSGLFEEETLRDERDIATSADAMRRPKMGMVARHNSQLSRAY